MLLLLAGCVSMPSPVRTPARLVHVVFFELADPAEADALRADCDRLLAPISDVRGYTLGAPVDIGRPSVLHDYDLALIVRFVDEAGYRAYLEHPGHLALVEAWKPRLAALRVHDFWDVGS